LMSISKRNNNRIKKGGKRKENNDTFESVVI